VNPVARRELQERFRTVRSPLLLGAWVVAAGVLTFLAYVYAHSAAEDRLSSLGYLNLGSLFASASMGRFILHAILLGLLTAVVFVVPGQAAVAIVGERERQTMPLLQVSQLTAWQIVVGKLMSALAFILLLLVATVPLLAIPVLLGGVTIWNAMAGVGMVAATAVTVGAVSMWVSSRAKSVQGAVLGSYVVAVGLVIGSLALLLAEVYLVGPAPDELGPVRIVSGVPRDTGRELYSSWFSPYVGMVDASSDVLDFRPDVVSSPYTPFWQVLLKRQGYAASSVDSLFGVYGGFGGIDIGFVDEIGLSRSTIAQSGAVAAAPIRGPVWMRTLLFEVLLTLLALVAAARAVKVPRQRMHVLRRKEPSGAS
jgi:ABC-type transport system involved in multi-copper enzyme maturation permease subunit